MRRSNPRVEILKPETINRRQFLSSSLMAGALAAAGRLPLLSAKESVGTGFDASTGPYAVKPVRDHLSRFLPVKTIPGSKQYVLTYDIVHWHWSKGQRGTYANTVIGEVTIDRKEAGSHVVYQVSQETLIGGVKNFIKAQIICDTDGLNSLRRWDFRSYEVDSKGNIRSLSKLTEKGSCIDGNIQIHSGNHQYGFYTKKEVLSQWTIPDVLICEAKLKSRITFDLLQDLSLLKPNQCLVYDGETHFRCKDGRSVTLQTYAQRGEGILPVHYLLDDQGWPHLITGSMVSWALSAQSTIT
ncbi:MAG: hypothetical protein GWN67_11495 [Phycisphaerae bacterium]|nr:hypothetical protein [Phycisphaerae bacterium]NIU09303.1 hypothetical protein [Phycisphaerae bacterium]NIU56975.1 hypothetical protein [Phycisphaerae bacterium]NIW93421.1 hypothetical protein [Phycisphaerae bacterium]NIW98999.1 hypothetical protein [Phycisphaerae bacterium]